MSKGTRLALPFALLAVLMYFPDQLARKYAIEQMALLDQNKPVDRKALQRIVQLIDVKAALVQSRDVLTARDDIKAYLEDAE